MKKIAALILMSLVALVLGCAPAQPTATQGSPATSTQAPATQASATAEAGSIDALLAEMVDALVQEATEAETTLQDEESDTDLLSDDSQELLDVGASATLEEEPDANTDTNESIASLVDSITDVLVESATAELAELDAEQTDGDLLEDDAQTILDVGDSYDSTTIE